MPPTGNGLYQGHIAVGFMLHNVLRVAVELHVVEAFSVFDVGISEDIDLFVAIIASAA